MFAKTLRIAALSALVAGVTTAGSIHARADVDRTQYLTFNEPVSLPGVTLHSGSYIFELASPESDHDIVRVMSRDRKIVYFTNYTRAVARPASTPMTQFVSLREAVPGEPVPISVWWSDASTGRQFIYAR